MPEIPLKRRERLALNLFDLDRMDATIRQLFLGGKLDLSAAIKVDSKRFDEAAVAFVCPLLTAACICDTLRYHDRQVRNHPTRVYLQKARAWTKFPRDAVLAVVVDGKPKLNPEWFPGVPEAVAPVKDVPPPDDGPVRF